MNPDQNIPASRVPIHLLLVEDNPGDARLVYEMLRNQLHLKLEVADCLAACMMRLDQGGIDLVLLDLGLGDSQGLDTLTSVAHTHPAMPVVALTGLDDDALALRTVQAGGQDYLTKNTVTPEILRRTIRHAFERKRTETALRESEEKFRVMVETIPLAIYLSVGIEQISEYLNPEFIKLFGYTQEDIPTIEKWWPLAYPDEEYRREISEEWTQRVKRAIETQSPIEPMEVVVTCKDGSKKNISWGYVTMGDKNYACGLDLTERKQAEEKVKKSLTEKEVLLKEVHHRVKNNLMTIIGLINMQEAKADNKMFNSLLLELEGRVRAMAMVHESLHKSADLAHVDLQNYIDILGAHICAQFGSDRELRFSVQAAGVDVGLDIAVPCGLILNELITNACKHAFPGNLPRAGKGNCEIAVTVKSEGGVATLSVADNGVGLPADLNLEKSETLGLRLVKMLSQQINGSIKVDRSVGTVFHLQFRVAVP
jgi:PAS domain S-box-containing protein